MPRDIYDDEDYSWVNYMQQNTGSTTGTKSTGTTTSTKWCSHDRDVFCVGGDKYVFLSGSGSRWRKGAATPVDMGVYLDSTWKTDLKASNDSNTFMSPNLPKELQPTEEFLATWNTTAIEEPMPGIFLQWQDHGIPDLASLKRLLAYVNPLIDAGKRIEIACIGGHGRTGTLAAAILASRTDLGAQQCIDYVRGAYCDKAIEDIRQEDIIFHLKGEPLPEKIKVKTVTPVEKAVTIATKNWYPVGMSVQEKKQLRQWFNDPKQAAERLAINWSLPILLREEYKENLIVPNNQIALVPNL